MSKYINIKNIDSKTNELYKNIEISNNNIKKNKVLYNYISKNRINSLFKDSILIINNNTNKKYNKNYINNIFNNINETSNKIKYKCLNKYNSLENINIVNTNIKPIFKKINFNKERNYYSNKNLNIINNKIKINKDNIENKYFHTINFNTAFSSINKSFYKKVSIVKNKDEFISKFIVKNVNDIRFMYKSNIINQLAKKIKNKNDKCIKLLNSNTKYNIYNNSSSNSKKYKLKLNNNLKNNTLKANKANLIYKETNYNRISNKHYKKIISINNLNNLNSKKLLHNSIDETHKLSQCIKDSIFKARKYLNFSFLDSNNNNYTKSDNNNNNNKVDINNIAFKKSFQMNKISFKINNAISNRSTIKKINPLKLKDIIINNSIKSLNKSNILNNLEYINLDSTISKENKYDIKINSKASVETNKLHELHNILDNIGNLKEKYLIKNKNNIISVNNCNNLLKDTFKTKLSQLSFKNSYNLNIKNKEEDSIKLTKLNYNVSVRKKNYEINDIRKNKLNLPKIEPCKIRIMREVSKINKNLVL